MNVGNFLLGIAGHFLPALGPIEQVLNILEGHSNPATNPILAAAPAVQSILNVIVAFEHGTTQWNQETPEQGVKDAVHIAFSQFPSLEATVPEEIVDDVVHALYEVLNFVAAHKAIAATTAPVAVYVTPVQPAAPVAIPVPEHRPVLSKPLVPAVQPQTSTPPSSTLQDLLSKPLPHVSDGPDDASLEGRATE